MAIILGSSKSSVQICGGKSAQNRNTNLKGGGGSDIKSFFSLIATKSLFNYRCPF
jgi:hypothetical protein